MMAVLTVEKARYSVRSYNTKKVEPDKLEKILTAAHVAPTAANRQPVRLIVVQEDATLAKVAMATDIYAAPLAIIVCVDRNRVWTRPYDGKTSADIDASILTDHMMLEATELGLGTVWICDFKPDLIRTHFALPESWEPVNILAIGYSDEPPADPDRHSSTRIPLRDIVFHERAR